MSNRMRLEDATMNQQRRRRVVELPGISLATWRSFPPLNANPGRVTEMGCWQHAAAASGPQRTLGEL